MLAEPRGVHIDIMYNNLNSLQHVWAWPAAVEPLLFMKYFNLRRFGVIHIMRENILDAYISNAVAIARGIFHTDAEQLYQRPLSIELDLNDLRFFLMGTLTARADVKKWLDGNNCAIEISYPEFINQNRIDRSIVNYNRALDGGDNLFGESELRKTTEMDYVTITNLKEAQKLYDSIKLSR